MAVTYNNRKQGAPSVMKRVLSGGSPAKAPGNFAHPKVAASAGKLARPGSGAIGPGAKSSVRVIAKQQAPTQRPNSYAPPSNGGAYYPGQTPGATYPSNTPKMQRGKAVTPNRPGPQLRPGQVKIASGGGVNVQGR